MKIARFLPRFRHARAALKGIASREEWTQDHIEAFQLQRLNGLWKHATEHVPYYRRLSADLFLPRKFDTLRHFSETVPVLAKARVPGHQKDFLSEQPRPGRWHKSGGSTGRPLHLFIEHEAHAERLQGKYRFHQAWGVELFDRIVFLWGHGASFAPGWQGRFARAARPIQDKLRNRLRLSAYHLGREDLRGYLRQVQEFRPLALYGYTRATELLAREALASGFRCSSLKVVILTAETVFPEARQIIERAFGVPVAVEYGAVECSFIAGERPDRQLRVQGDNVIVETLPRTDGRFDIVITPLSNPSFPLIRYAIGDTTAEALRQPERGYSVLMPVTGRINDVIVTRSGRILHSSGLEHAFMLKHGGIRHFSAHQTVSGEMRVSIEMEDQSAVLDTREITQKLEALLEGYPVVVQQVTAVPQTPAGKHRMFSSDLCPL